MSATETTDLTTLDPAVVALAGELQRTHASPRATWRVTPDDGNASAAVVADIVTELEREGLWPVPERGGERVAVYVRISNDQAGDAHGVRNQALAAYRLALANGWAIVLDGDAPVFVDNDISASRYARKHRPAFDRLTAAIAGGHVDIVYAAKLDRLFRSPRHFGWWLDIAEHGRVLDVRELGAKVHGTPRPFAILTGDGGRFDMASSTDRTLAGIVVGMATQASDDTSWRVKRQNDAVRNRGRATAGPAPFGLVRDADARGGYAVDPAPAALLRNAADRLIAGTVSLTALAREWQAADVPRRRGGSKWTATLVKRYLTRPSLAGDLVHNGETVKRDAWAPVFDRTTWDALTAVLDDIGSQHRNPRRRRLFSRVLVCDECSLVLVGTAGGAWACRHNPERMGHLTVGKYLDDYLARLMVDRLVYLTANPPTTTAGDDPDLLVAIAERDAAERHLAELDALYLDDPDALPAAVYARQRRKLATANDEARAKVATVRARALKVAKLPTGDADSIRADFDALTFDEQRAIVTTTFAEVRVKSGTPGRNKWTDEQIAERVDIVWGES